MIDDYEDQYGTLISSLFNQDGSALTSPAIYGIYNKYNSYINITLGG